MANNMLQSLLFSGGGSGGGSGGDGGVLVVHDIDGTLDKTWKEIYDAPFSVFRGEEDGVVQFGLLGIGHSGDSYSVAIFYNDTTFIYSTDSEDGYPAKGGR